MSEPDVVIVGGGIAGGALATVMARAGAGVLVLERQREYRDHVRGEILWPWGVRAAQLLGIESVLLDAGALVVGWLDTCDEQRRRPAALELSYATGFDTLPQDLTQTELDTRLHARR